MRKGVLELLLTVATIALLFFGLSRINWVALLHTDKLPSLDEKKIEKFLWENCERTLDLDTAQNSCRIETQKLVWALCRSNEWSDTTFQLHINRSKEVNAFAYPGGHIVVNKGLIARCKTEGELLSVIAHEAAHINENHPMELLKREIGISILSGLILGEHSSKTIGQITKTLSISSYQREEETQADLLGINYLINCNIDPHEFINFQRELAKSESTLSKSFDWIQSHPNWEQRIADLQEELNSIDYKPSSTIKILTQLQWANLKESAQE